ncbi:MAG: glycosyltransferase family 9 protein [Deltaproteobacteria bacterium]|nr:glycosyltransferase family 9 protein [Deltaproteobacteria bacterium]MBI3017563.1 glycosyltransferase family 9 protein [Deltaproteobacteria bacterium]
MNLKYIKAVDYWIGIPLCFLLSSLNRLIKFKDRLKSNPLKTPNKILFILLSEMGVAIATYPTIMETKKKFPHAVFYFLTFEKNRSCIEALKIITPENILTIRSSFLFLFIKDTLYTLFKLYAKNISLVFDFELFSRYSTIISYLTRAPKRIGFHKFTMEGLYRGNLMTHKVQYNPHQHMSKNFLLFLENLDASQNNSPMVSRTINHSRIQVPHIMSTPENILKLKEKLKKLNSEITQAQTILLFNISGGILPLRTWPLKYFIHLSKILLESEKNFLILIGDQESKKENEALLKALEHHPRCLDLSNQTSFEEVLTLYDIAHILISNDSGPAHFASLKPHLKTFVLFGPETPILYSPMGSNITPLYAHFSCSPCFSAFNHRTSYCTDNKCLQAISPEYVYSFVQTELNKAQYA